MNNKYLLSLNYKEITHAINGNNKAVAIMFYVWFYVPIIPVSKTISFKQ